MKRSSQWLMLLAAVCACKGGDMKAGSASVAVEQAPMAPEQAAPAGMALEVEEEAKKEAPADEGGFGMADRMASDPMLAGKLDDSRRSRNEADKDAKGGGGAGESAAPTRAWFPETFLFEPLIETDESGVASLSVRVPDRLTTWRVLGLAHSRDGAQAGAVTSFLGTLPVYIEPVVPAFLRAGDQVNLPVQVVNTTAEPVTSQLVLEVAGAELVGAATSTLALAANASAVRYVTLRATRPGDVRLLARLGNADSTVREIPVYPRLKPVTSTHRGTLALPRTVKLALPEGADPGQSTARLSVYPGALAMLRAELAAAPARTGDVADDAFALLLAGTAPEILRSLGDQPKDKAETDAMRSMTIVASQRIVRHARVLRSDTAALIAEAALAHRDASPILARIGQRAVVHIEANQSPDGTCSGEDGWTLQRLLVATAECVRAAKSSRSVGIRAAGAFERHAERIQDPYTAAAILASGATISEPLAGSLRKLIRDAIKDRDDSAKVIELPADVVRADGRRPSDIEATALAVLALAGDAEAPRADLGAAVLSGYIPGYGWGDGRASLVAMQAVIALFSEPLPGEIRVTLSMNGQPMAQGMLDRERSRELMVLDAAVPSQGALAPSAEQTWEIRAEPPLAGLGYALSLTSYVPWPKANEGSGMALDVSVPQNLRVGQVAELAVRASAPSGQALRVRLELPAGVQVDTGALDKLTAEGMLLRYEQSDERLDLHVAPLQPAQLFSASIRVIPTLSGELQSGPATLSLATGAGELDTVAPPVRWIIR